MKKQSNGLYRTKIVIGHDENGKQINKWISAKTKKELEAKRLEAVDKYINGNRSYDRITFGEYAKQWFEIKKKPFLEASSIYAYSMILNRKLLPIFKDRPLNSITHLEIQEYINSLSSMSRARTELIFVVLTSLFGTAFDEGILRTNPTRRINLVGIEKKEKYILSADERRTIENACTQHKYGLMLALLYYTGMRKGEMGALRWEDIDLESRQIHITKALKAQGKEIGKTKTKSSVRTIPITEPLYNLLLPNRGEPDDYLIHLTNKTKQPASISGINDRWIELMMYCGIGEPVQTENNRHSAHWKTPATPHTLRHNFTTMLYESGVDPYTASRLLGHSSIKTTMDIYAHFSKTAMANAAEKLDNIFKVAQK